MDEKTELNQEVLSILEYYRERGMSDEQIELLCVCFVALYNFCFVELSYLILFKSLRNLIIKGW